MPDLTLALIQANPLWHQPEANRNYFASLLEKVPAGTDLVVLPEMFTTGFTMASSEMAETMEGPALRWLQEQARSLGAAVCGSVIIKENGHYYNRFLFAGPGGTVRSYDKHHLFRMAGEHHHYSPGNHRVVLEFRGWRIMPQICYDLRFPVWSRNRFTEGRAAYDLLLYVANWPAARISAWDALLPARAIENLCYSAGVNRTGTDGLEVVYNGHTAAYGPKGETLCLAGEQEEICSLTLSAHDLAAYRSKFPAWQDADDFELKLK